jgi:predicted dehydrogenase
MSSRGYIGVGIAGTAWITRTHAHALQTINQIAPLPREVRLVNVYGRREEAARRTQEAFGIMRATTRWQDLAEDPEVDVIANLTTNILHEPVSVAALNAGKPVLCEKPLAISAGSAARMQAAAKTAALPTACGFSYRFLPAIRLFHDLVHSGQLGNIRHFRGLYLQDGVRRPESAETSGSGSVLDFSHLLDMLRHLAGEPRSVTAITSSFGGDGDDCFAALFHMGGAGTATLEASRFATGWKARQRYEVSGTEGAAWWDMEDMNRLHVMFRKDGQESLGGFRDVLVTEPEHPFMKPWWPPGCSLGWEHAFVHQWRAFLAEVIGEKRDPLLADFADGLRAAEIADAIYLSNRTRMQADLTEFSAARTS